MSANIAIVGYGRMGHEVEAQALDRGHTITHTIDESDDIAATDFSGTDVAIEFTHPTAVIANIEALADKKLNTIVGTTGWNDQLDHVRDVVEQSGIGLLYAPNFSIGVNLFWRIVGDATNVMNAVDNYDVFGHEYHHAKKADSPSGTALKTADVILDNSDRKNALVTDKLDRPPETNELHFSSTRGGSVPGTHSVFFDSPADTIEITHTARNRSGFALGAVLAGEWLVGKTGLFTMDDFLNDFLKS